MRPSGTRRICAIRFRGPPAPGYYHGALRAQAAPSARVLTVPRMVVSRAELRITAEGEVATKSHEKSQEGMKRSHGSEDARSLWFFVPFRGDPNSTTYVLDGLRMVTSGNVRTK